MAVNKTYYFLGRFSNEELNKLLKFLIYLYDKGDQKVTFLKWFVLQKFENNLLTNRGVYLKYGPTYSQGHFSNLITGLGSDIDKYLFAEDALGSSVQMESSLIKIYAERGDRVLLEKLMGKLETKAETDDISLDAELHLMVAYHQNYYSGIIEDRDVHNRMFEQMLSSFKIFSAKMAQLYHTEIVNRKLLFEKSFVDEEKYMKPFLEVETNIKVVSELLNSMLSKANDNAFKELYQLLKKSEHWAHTLRFVVFTYMTSYLNIILKGKDKGRLMELLELYRFGVDHNLLSNNRNIPFVVFNNIIGAAGKAGEYDWTKTFIQDAIHKVDAGDYQSLKNYAEAKLEFQVKNFDKSIRLLAGFKHKSAHVEYSALWIYFCATYEESSEHMELIKAQILSLSRFLKLNRGNLTQSSIRGSRNTLKVISMSYNPNNTEKIKSFLDAESQFVNSKWLMDVLDRKKIIKRGLLF